MAKEKKPRATVPPAERTGKSKGPGAKPLPRPSEPRMQSVLHDLNVHQLELELQNEELRSARVEMEAALARYTELFDFAPIGYATITAQHALADINHAGAQLLGRERSRLRGWPFELLVRPEHQHTVRQLLASVAASSSRQSCELELARAGSERVVIRLSATILQHKEPQFLLAFEDISVGKRREQKLQLTERALREADRRKDEFLATLSHELRNPLAPIRNSVFVLSRSAPGSEAAHRAQVIIDRQVTHLTRLIDDLLDVTRIARGKIQLQLEHVELGALLRRTLDDHRGSFEALGVQLDCHLTASTDVWIQADSARVVQMISNVLTNSLKFTARGGSVSVYLQREDEEAAVLRVIDTGVGIPEDVLEHVFEPFAQAPQTLDRARGGLGLGLAMVKGLVELHGGTVSIRSPGLSRGTEVRLSFPLGAAPVREQVESVPLSRGPRRVLVIEDNLDASDTLQIALTLNGHEVKVAHDGTHGLELAAAFEPDIVICDIGLPGMDGYDVARAFRRHQTLRDTFLVALSGYAQPEDLQRAREAGFNRHVAKPTSLDSLEHLLAEAPRHSRSREERTDSQLHAS
jgi:PAS domain S-box-containing protein